MELHHLRRQIMNCQPKGRRPIEWWRDRLIGQEDGFDLKAQTLTLMIMNLFFTAKLRNMAFHPLANMVVDFLCTEMNFLSSSQTLLRWHCAVTVEDLCLSSISDAPWVSGAVIPSACFLAAGVKFAAWSLCSYISSTYTHCMVLSLLLWLLCLRSVNMCS